MVVRKYQNKLKPHVTQLQLFDDLGEFLIDQK